MSISLATIYRYPVKGFSPQALEQVDVLEGQPLPWDRAFAIENGPSGFDLRKPAHVDKTFFLMLMRHPEFAKLRTHFDETCGDLSIELDGELKAKGNLFDEEDHAPLLEWLADYKTKPPRGALRVRHAPGHAFTDTRTQDVSLINMASVRDISNHAGEDLDPIRFRGNLYIEGAKPWQEHEWVGRKLAIGDAIFQGRKRTDRCASTNASPETGKWNLNIPKVLMKTYGHADCGIHLVPENDAQIRLGDQLIVLD